MSKRALLAWGFLFAAFAAPGLAANLMLTGKPVSWENWGDSQTVASAPLTIQSDETPNQRRQRLGLPVEPSLPAQEFGEISETPNQRRSRLAAIGQIPATDYYVQDSPEIDEESNDRLAAIIR